MKRTTQITIVPNGHPIFSELATVVTVDDEACGEFLTLSQPSSDATEIRISADEWPELRDAIDSMFAEIAMHERKTE